MCTCEDQYSYDQVFSFDQKKMDEKKEKCLRESAINCGGFCKNLINNVSKDHTSGNYLGERIRSPS